MYRGRRRRALEESGLQRAVGTFEIRCCMGTPPERKCKVRRQAGNVRQLIAALYVGLFMVLSLPKRKSAVSATLNGIDRRSPFRASGCDKTRCSRIARGVSHSRKL